MNIRTQIFVGVIILLAVVGLFSMVKKNKIQLKYALLWFLMAMGILLLDIFPGIVTAAARFFGISVPINMLFFVGLLFASVIIFALTIIVSDLSHKSKKMTQEIALLRKEVEELKHE